MQRRKEQDLVNSVTSTQTILIVEDSEDDYDATVRALTKGTNLRNPIRHCEDGQECLDYLYHRGRYAEQETAPRPGIILLDLNLPGIDGRKVLSEVKSDPELRAIPVVIMTNSEDDRDINRCYQTGANTYVPKPVDWEGFFQAMTRLKEYWFEIAILPKT